MFNEFSNVSFLPPQSRKNRDFISFNIFAQKASENGFI